MDTSYCLIRVNNHSNISIYFFDLSKIMSQYPVCITANQSDKIYYLISLHHYCSSLSIFHYLYLGKELYKAELALLFQQDYVQN